MGNVWYIVILCVGILYVLNPIDLVPDVIPILGWIEALLVFAAALPKTPWQLLDIKASAADAEVKAAYRAKLMQYHPDRVAPLGEDVQRLAHEKKLEIQRAYEHIKRRRT
jgi:preprotein translocase subunit Sec63